MLNYLYCLNNIICIVSIVCNFFFLVKSYNGVQSVMTIYTIKSGIRNLFRKSLL